MNILIVSATEFEIKPLLDYLEIEQPAFGLNSSCNLQIKNNNISVLITGVGMVNTAFMLGKHLTNDYDLVLNVGVCGSFSKSFDLAEIVHVIKDVLSELGAEDGDNFLTYDQLNLPGIYQFCNKFKLSNSLINSLPVVNGITVNTVHGNETSIKKVKQVFNPDIESMEGAAFYASCLNYTFQYTQIRAISNYVEKRDKSKWQMPLAIKKLNQFLINFITSNL